MAERKRQRVRVRAAGTQSTTVEEKHSGEVVRHEEDNVTPTVELDCEHPARVRVEGSITQNMGDFNSVRVGVVIEMPCLPTESAINKTYDRVSAMVDEKLNNELDLAVGPQQ